MGGSKVVILFMLIEFELSSSPGKKPLTELVIQFLGVQVEWLQHGLKSLLEWPLEEYI